MGVFYNSAADLTTFSSSAQPNIPAHRGARPGWICDFRRQHHGRRIGDNHAGVTPVSGAFYRLVVSPTANVPYGPVSVVIGGTIQLCSRQHPTSSGTWGGALISSVQGTASSTGVAATDSSTYKPQHFQPRLYHSSAPIQNQVGFFGVWLCPPN